jgi:hypothetical protein
MFNSLVERVLRQCHVALLRNNCCLHGSRNSLVMREYSGFRQDVFHQLAKDEDLKAICERLHYAGKSAKLQSRDLITWDDVMFVEDWW